MRSISLLLLAGLAPLAWASPVPDKDPVEYTPKATKTKTCVCPKPTPRPEKRSEPTAKCLTQDDVDIVIDEYTYLVEQPGVDPEKFNATAENLLTKDFKVSSESILTLTNRPLGQGIPAYGSLSDFLDGQFTTPAVPVVKTRDVFYSCKKISWQWTALGVGSGDLPVNGVTDFELVHVDDKSPKAPSPEPAAAPVTTTAEPADTPPTSTSNPAAETILPGCVYGDASDGGPGAGICPPKVKRAVTTTTTSTTASLSPTLDDAALDLLAALADDSIDISIDEGPGCAPGNSPDGDPSAGGGAKRRSVPVLEEEAVPVEDILPLRKGKTSSTTTSTAIPTVKPIPDYGRPSARAVAKRSVPVLEEEAVPVEDILPLHKSRTSSSTTSTTTIPTVKAIPDYGRPTARAVAMRNRNEKRSVPVLEEEAVPVEDILPLDEKEEDTEDTETELEKKAETETEWKVKVVHTEFNSAAWLSNLEDE